MISVGFLLASLACWTLKLVNRVRNMLLFRHFPGLISNSLKLVVCPSILRSSSVRCLTNSPLGPQGRRLEPFGNAGHILTNFLVRQKTPQGQKNAVAEMWPHSKFICVRFLFGLVEEAYNYSRTSSTVIPYSGLSFVENNQ